MFISFLPQVLYWLHSPGVVFANKYRGYFTHIRDTAVAGNTVSPLFSVGQ